MTTLDSVFWAAVIGAVVFVGLNHIGEPTVPSDSQAITNGAIIGASVQLVVRLTGIS